MREHNFKICTCRKAVDPTQELWHCYLCDTIITVSKGQDIYAINRYMANRVACLDPIVTPVDEVVDKRTINLKPKLPTIDRVLGRKK